MPLFLQAPSYDPNGPDQQGRNRLRIEVLDMHDQCAAMPMTIRKLLRESYDTRHARWGGFGPCQNNGDCNACAAQEPIVLGYLPDRLPVRIDENGIPWIMNRLDNGWGEYGVMTTLKTLANAEDYFFESTRIERDDTSEYLWLVKSKC